MDRDWTDKRADDLADRVDRFEANVGKRFDKVDERFDRADAREIEGFAAIRAELAMLSAKMDKSNRLVMTGLFSVVGAVVIKIFLG
jgi:hypothetical protein